MTQASLAPDMPSAMPQMPSDHASDTSGAGRPAVTLWLFGLTAMTLVFASLLLLGLLARSEIVDASIQSAVNAYTVLTAAIGLVAMAYVLTMGRRAGLFGSTRVTDSDTQLSTETGGLMIAPTVPPGIALRARQEAERSRQARSQRARAIATASAPRQGARPATAYRAPAMAQRVVPVAAPPRAAPVPRPATQPSYRPPTTATPTATPATSPETPGPTAKAVQPRTMVGGRATVTTPRPKVLPPTMPGPRAPVAAPRPVSVMRPPAAPALGAPAAAPRPARAPAVSPRISSAPPMPRVQPVALQVRAASLRGPVMEQPYRPTLTDRLLGRGTHRAAQSMGLPAVVPTPVVQAPQAVRTY